MIKKILSLIICTSIILSMCIVSVNGSETQVISQGYDLIEDFEGEDHIFSAGTVSDGVISHTSTMVTSFDLPSEFVLVFDAYRTDSGYFDIYIKDSDFSTAPHFGLRIMQDSYEANKWYTYRMEIDSALLVNDNGNNNATAIKIYRKAENETEWELAIMQTGSNAVPGDKIGVPMVRFHNGIGSAGLSDKSIGFYKNTFFDNVKIFGKKSFVGDIWFEDINGEKLNAVSSGEIIPRFLFENYGGIESVTLLTALYDKNNQLVQFASVPVDSLTVGFHTLTGASVEGISAVDGGRVEAFLWSSVDDMTPIGETYGVLGTDKNVESSTTGASLGNVGEMKTNYFTACDRSTFANTIMIEGAHSTESKVPVTIKAVGKTTGKELIISQFNTESDGTFKIKFAINEELCTNDTEATVTLAGIDTTSVSFDVPVFSNWTDMMNDFMNLDADSVDEYYNMYEDNLGCYFAGDTDITTVDIAALSADDFADVAFVKARRIYEGITVENVVEESIALIECLEDVAAFEDAFSETKALETETEKIAAIKTLLTETDLFTFSTEGVSNVDAICKALISSEATEIADIYADFETAYETQKSAEEATVPGFTSITSGAELKQFFADNEVVLGVDPEKYKDTDYEVMYDTYEEKGYSTLETYVAVNEAIVFLDNYINEYHQFMGLIKDAATVAKSWETIKALLNNTYNYIEIDLVDETAVVNKEYLYNRLVDMDCTSLQSVEGAFADAVVAQTAYEIAAKDAFITITDAASIKVYFVEYADMLGVPAAKNYTDVELEVFVEVYAKFVPTASNYADAVEKTNDLIEKHKVAMKLIADVNAEAETSDWAGIKKLYEGSISGEFLGISIETHEINDVRSMYKRIANDAPFSSLSDLITVWNNAYAEQKHYEAIAGGYETFDEERYFFEELEWNLTVSGNVVNLKGKVNKNGLHQLTLYVEDQEKHPIYVKQLVTEPKGDFVITFILNPDKYNANNPATLRIGGEFVNVYTFAPFELYSADELKTVIDSFVSISNKADLKNFLKTYEEILGMEVDTENDRIIEALYFLYDRNKDAGLYDDISDIDEVLNGIDDESGTVVLMSTMNRMIKCLDDLTEAANEKVGSGIGRWENIKVQVDLAIKEGWIEPKTTGKISSEASMYLKMSGSDYNYMSDVEEAYVDAFNAQKNEEKKPASTGGGGGGGSFSPNIGSGSDGKVQTGAGTALENVKGEYVLGSDSDERIEETELKLNQEDHPEAPFKDVTEEYLWASESIHDLRKFGLVRGDGNGNFRPGDGISREEFITILLNVFAVERKTGLSTSFKDVDKNAWYYDTVTTAYEMGIIKGYSETEFGIGDTISRADMAVLICRAMEYAKMNLNPTQEAFIFNDSADIPDYAYQEVSKLQQVGVLNGDTFGFYNPLNKVTRAESAVALWNVFDRTKDFVYYSWEKVY